jgi:excisionase family DNA binding protein
MENMRAKEAHKYLGIGKSTLWSLVAQKRIKAYKISDRITIFKKSELDAFINGGAK